MFTRLHKEKHLWLYSSGRKSLSILIVRWRQLNAYQSFQVKYWAQFLKCKCMDSDNLSLKMIWGNSALIDFYCTQQSDTSPAPPNPHWRGRLNRSCHEVRLPPFHPSCGVPGNPAQLNTPSTQNTGPSPCPKVESWWEVPKWVIAVTLKDNPWGQMPVLGSLHPH